MENVGQGGCVFRVNDYAYVAPASDDTAVERHIMRIERLHRDADGQTFARGIWCYRPEETFHLATRKFLENVGWKDLLYLLLYLKLQTLSLQCENLIKTPDKVFNQCSTLLNEILLLAQKS